MRLIIIVDPVYGTCRAGRHCCSGEDKGGKYTYALLEERVPPVPEITKDEALARLARSYFRSHAPAVLQDFNGGPDCMYRRLNRLSI